MVGIALAAITVSILCPGCSPDRAQCLGLGHDFWLLPIVAGGVVGHGFAGLFAELSRELASGQRGEARAGRRSSVFGGPVDRHWRGRDPGSAGGGPGATIGGAAAGMD